MINFDTIHYINLTNGIEAIPSIEGDVRFIRIQSTACEQKRWDFILQDLDNDFYMNLALGNECLVYDYGARKIVSRAIYQGLEFVRYSLERRWFDNDYKPFIVRSSTRKAQDCAKYFESCYRALDDRTLKKLRYFKKFLLTDELRLKVVTSSTMNDGNVEYYSGILWDYVSYERI